MLHEHVCEDFSVSDSTQIVSFQLSEVPEYLRNTDFYLTLEDDGEEITLPRQFFKKDFNILAPADARDLLSTMRFWGVEKIPSELIMYVAKSSHQDLNDMLSQFTQELIVVEFLRLMNLQLHHIRASTFDEYLNWRHLKRAKTTLESVVSILALQFQHERGQIWNEQTTALVAEMGWLDCLTFLYEMGCPWGVSACSNASKNNHLDCLKYAHTHGCPWDAQTTCQALQLLHTECFTYARDNCCPCDAASSSAAARFGKLSLLTFAHENGCPWDEKTCDSAARADSLDCLRYAHEEGCSWGTSTCAAAASAGNLMALVYAHEHGCPWDKSTCQKAAEHGYVACLVYAHDHGCPWDEATTIAAARQKSAACLAYAHKHGCPWNEGVVKEAAFCSSIECLRYALDNGCPGREIACVSVYRSPECLKYLREEQLCPWDSRIADDFARSLSKDTTCLQYCLEQGCLADESTMLLAAHSLEKLQVLHKYGCPWDKRTLHAVALAGDLDKFKYCVENNCPGREDVVLSSAPHLPLLQYLHAQKCCPLLPEAYECALQAVRPIKCVRFLFETGCCPWPKDACTWFVQHRRMDCLNYAHMHGAPWDADTCAAAAALTTPTDLFCVRKVCTADEQRCALDFLRYLHEEGCPWNALTVIKAMQCSNFFCLKYALQHECPNIFVCNGTVCMLQKDDGSFGQLDKGIYLVTGKKNGQIVTWNDIEITKQGSGTRNSSVMGVDSGNRSGTYDEFGAACGSSSAGNIEASAYQASTKHSFFETENRLTGAGASQRKTSCSGLSRLLLGLGTALVFAVVSGAVIMIARNFVM